MFFDFTFSLLKIPQFVCLPKTFVCLIILTNLCWACKCIQANCNTEKQLRKRLSMQESCLHSGAFQKERGNKRKRLLSLVCVCCIPSGVMHQHQNTGAAAFWDSNIKLESRYFFLITSKIIFSTLYFYMFII